MKKVKNGFQCNLTMKFSIVFIVINYSLMVTSCKKSYIKEEHIIDSLFNLSYDLSTIQPDSSIALAIIANKLSTEINYEKGIGLSLHAIAYAYQSKGNISQAMSYYSKSLQSFEIINDLSNISSTYGGQRELFELAKNYEKAYEYYTKEDSIDKLLNIYDYSFKDLINKSDLLINLNKLEEAKKILIRAESLSKKDKDNTDIGYLYNSLANLNAANNNNNTAISFYSKAIKSYPRNDSEAINTTKLRLAKIYFKQKKYDSCIQYSLSSYNSSSKSILKKLDACKQLQISYEMLDSSINLKYLKECFQLEDTLLIGTMPIFQNLSITEDNRERVYKMKYENDKKSHDDLIYSLLIFFLLFSIFILLLLYGNVFNKSKFKNSIFKFSWSLEILMLYEFCILISEEYLHKKFENTLTIFIIQIIIGGVLVKLHEISERKIKNKYFN